MRFQTPLLFIIFSFLCACTTAPKTSTNILVFTTDFGVKDGAVSAMKGVSYAVSDRLVISDLTHEIPPFDIWQAGYRLQQTYPYWPKGTVFVTVVDPGVGSERKAIVAKVKSGQYFVGPDNGLLTLFNSEVESVRVIDAKKHLRAGSEQSHTFHGRDLFAVTGAKLASHKISFEEVGPLLDRPLIQLPVQPPEFKNSELRGMIPVLDPNYGNVWTNIPKKLFIESFSKQKTFLLKIKRKGKTVFSGTLPLSETFASVPQGQPLLYFNSLLNLAVALNQGDFAKKHHIGSGPEWTVTIKEVPWK